MSQLSKFLTRYLLRGRYNYPYRKYNDQGRLIFIHIPKTAGSSLLDAIGAPAGNRLHIDYFQYLRSDPERFRDYHKFSVVRNPADRAHSCYRYFLAGGNGGEDDLVMAQQIKERCDDFSEFVLGFITPSMMSQWNMLRPQCSYICSKTGKLMVDSLLRYESLDEDYKELRKAIPGVAPELKKLNQTAKSREVSISKEAMDRMRVLYSIDYELFYGSL